MVKKFLSAIVNMTDLSKKRARKVARRLNKTAKKLWREHQAFMQDNPSTRSSWTF